MSLLGLLASYVLGGSSVPSYGPYYGAAGKHQMPRT